MQKKIENDSKYEIIKNFVMELKNTNSNGWNVVINNVHSMILFMF